MEFTESSSISREKLLHRQKKGMPNEAVEDKKNRLTKSSSTALRSGITDSRTPAQKRQGRVSWADMESDGPDLNGHAPLNLNGIPSHSSSAGGNENGRRKNLEPKRERGHKTRENGAAGAHRTSRKRKESPNDIDPISLEELGGPSMPPAGPLGNPAQQREREEADMSWNSQSDYVAVYMTYVLGIGNVIHFPQLCYRHGGGAFFVPYFVMLVLEGIPLVCLEMAVGQRFGKNSFLNAWKDLSPSLRGVAMAAIIETLLCVLYYNFYVSWGLFYFAHSLGTVLPWRSCPESEHQVNGTTVWKADLECLKSGPAQYYWYRKTLDIADDINHSTGVNMYLYLFVVISWVITFLVVMKGIRRAPKPLKVCLLSILLILATFFFVGVHLDGWAEGLALLFIPKWEKLLDPVVWMDAAGQNFYSLGIGFGSISLFATGNKPSNSFYEDALVYALGNGMTSMLASIIIFSFFGFTVNYKLKHCEVNTTMSTISIPQVPCNRTAILDEIPSGVALAFAGLSEAFDKMKSLPTLWSSLFYLLIFLLGASSMLGMVDILVRTAREIGLFPQTWRNELVSGIICLAICVLNLMFVQSTGIYLVGIIGGASSLPLLFTGLAECIAVSYIYGISRFCKDLSLLTGEQPKLRWKLCWWLVSPLIIMGVIAGGITQMVRAGQLTYGAWDRDKAAVVSRPYPFWAYVLYVSLVAVPILSIIYPLLADYVSKYRHYPQEPDDEVVRCNPCIRLHEACKSCTVVKVRSYSVSGGGEAVLEVSGPQVNNALSTTSLPNP